MIVVVANGVSVNGGVIGSADHPAWLTFNIYAGGLTLNSGANVYGYVAAPRGAGGYQRKLPGRWRAGE